MKKIILYRFFLISLVATMGIIGTVRAENPPIKAELLTPVQQRMQQEVSVDFRETPIEDVLRILAKQADVDIIKSPKVVGTVTATLTDIPLSEALENILSSQGYAFVTTTNMIRVVPKEELVEAHEKLVSRVYRITYADVKEVEAALKKFISQEGSISSNAGTSNIIVTDTEGKINAINSFINEIDRITPQILVEAKIYDISSKDNLDLGVEWQGGTATSYGTPVEAGRLGNAYSTLGNAIYGQPATTYPFASETNPFTTGSFNPGTLSKSTADGALRFGYLKDSLNIDAIIHAGQEDVRAKLLANPRIMVLDNQQAEIKIVEEIPFQQLSDTSGGGNIGTTQFREVGVDLRVVPHLTREGLIRLLLNPKFSARTGDVTVITSGSAAIPEPIISTRETTTTALIKDGQTVVISGLKKQDVSQQINKVPLLGDLPLLGLLFRFRGESTQNSELVVFITPAIIEEPLLNKNDKRCLDDTAFETPRIPEIPYGKKKPEK